MQTMEDHIKSLAQDRMLDPEETALYLDEKKRLLAEEGR